MGFIKKYWKYIIVIVVIILIATVFVVKSLTTNTNQDTDMGKYEIRMYNFGMVSCPACEAVKPTYDKVKEKYKDEIQFVEIDVNKNVALANKFKIQYTPTFILVDKNDNILTGFYGVATMEEFDKYIDVARSKK